MTEIRDAYPVHLRVCLDCGFVGDAEDETERQCHLASVLVGHDDVVLDPSGGRAMRVKLNGSWRELKPCRSRTRSESPRS